MIDPQEMASAAEPAVRLLKALANPNRLLILSILSRGERSVGELEQLLKIRQPTLSQQLAVLREEALVETRRDGKLVFYRLVSDKPKRVIRLLCEFYGKALPRPPIAPGARQPLE